MEVILIKGGEFFSGAFDMPRVKSREGAKRVATEALEGAERLQLA